MLNGVTFVFFGAILLGPALGELRWELALYAVLSLTLVRMLPVAIAMLGSKARSPTLGFLGWFGPRGLASIVFAARDRGRGIKPSPRAPDRARDLFDRRPVGLRPRSQRGPAGHPVRPLVHTSPRTRIAAHRGSDLIGPTATFIPTRRCAALSTNEACGSGARRLPDMDRMDAAFLDAGPARTRRPPYDRVASPRSYASALAFSASNSSCVSVPASSSSFAFAISAADPPPPAVSRT